MRKKTIFFICSLVFGAGLYLSTYIILSSSNDVVDSFVKDVCRGNPIFNEDFDDGDISDWTITTAGNGIFETSTTTYVSAPYSIHMKSLNQFDQAMGVSPSYSLNLSLDYEISFYFYLYHPVLYK